MKLSIQDSITIQKRKIGRAIHTARTKNKISMTEFSRVTRIDRSTLYRVEKGETNATIETLTIICWYLDVELKDIV